MSAGRIALLTARIAAREGKPGYKRNVAAMKGELAKLQAATVQAPKADPKEPAGDKP